MCYVTPGRVPTISFLCLGVAKSHAGVCLVANLQRVFLHFCSCFSLYMYSVLSVTIVNYIYQNIPVNSADRR